MACPTAHPLRFGISDGGMHGFALDNLRVIRCRNRVDIGSCANEVGDGSGGRQRRPITNPIRDRISGYGSLPPGARSKGGDRIIKGGTAVREILLDTSLETLLERDVIGDVPAIEAGVAVIAFIDRLAVQRLVEGTAGTPCEAEVILQLRYRKWMGTSRHPQRISHRPHPTSRRGDSKYAIECRRTGLCPESTAMSIRAHDPGAAGGRLAMPLGVETEQARHRIDLAARGLLPISSRWARRSRSEPE